MCMPTNTYTHAEEMVEMVIYSQSDSAGKKGLVMSRLVQQFREGQFLSQAKLHMVMTITGNSTMK